MLTCLELDGVAKGWTQWDVPQHAWPCLQSGAMWLGLSPSLLLREEGDPRGFPEPSTDQFQGWFPLYPLGEQVKEASPDSRTGQWAALLSGGRRYKGFGAIFTSYHGMGAVPQWGVQGRSGFLLSAPCISHGTLRIVPVLSVSSVPLRLAPPLASLLPAPLTFWGHFW